MASRDDPDTHRTLSVGLASMNEASNGWAYFAKKEWDASKAPCVLYALKAPLGVAALVLNPNTVVGGNSVTATVYLNGTAPTGGVTVSLGSSDPDTAQVAESVT